MDTGKTYEISVTDFQRYGIEDDLGWGSLIFCPVLPPINIESGDVGESSQVGNRYGDGEHQWQVTVNDTNHVVTLKCGFEHTLILDDDVIESGYVRSHKTYKFEIDGERALVSSRASRKHGYVHRLFVSGKKVDQYLYCHILHL